MLALLLTSLEALSTQETISIRNLACKDKCLLILVTFEGELHSPDQAVSEQIYGLLLLFQLLAIKETL